MRGRLVAAALDVLQRGGASALTVRAITQAAGCSTTGVYTYFGSKHGLVEAIFIDGFESFDGAVRASLAVGDMRGAGRAYRRWALGHPTQYMVMFGRAVPEYEPSPVAYERSLMSFADLAEAIARVTNGPDGAELDAGATAYHYWATLHGYVMLELAGMGAATSAESDALFEGALDRLTVA